MSMGNYIFSTDVLVESLKNDDAGDEVPCTTWAATSSRC